MFNYISFYKYEKELMREIWFFDSFATDFHISSVSFSSFINLSQKNIASRTIWLPGATCLPYRSKILLSFFILENAIKFKFPNIFHEKYPYRFLSSIRGIFQIGLAVLLKFCWLIYIFVRFAYIKDRLRSRLIRTAKSLLYLYVPRI